MGPATGINKMKIHMIFFIQESFFLIKLNIQATETKNEQTQTQK